MTSEKIVDAVVHCLERELNQLAAAYCSQPPDSPYAVDVSNEMRKVLAKGVDRLAHESTSDQSEVRRLFQHRVESLFRPSVYYARAFEKPRGYPGDYLAMDMMYLRKPLPRSSTHRFAEALDALFLDAPSSQANRNRQRYLVSLLVEQCSAQRARRIASLACGPCRELCTCLTNLTPTAPLDFLMVDFDKEALEYAEGLLTPFRASNHVGIEYARANLVRQVMGNGLASVESGFDLVYCIGFADYISDRMLSKLVESVHAILAPGGTFVLGQFLSRDDHPDRLSMEWVLDWHLKYRTQDHLWTLLSGTPFGDECRFVIEPMNIIAFAELRKT